MSGKLSTHVLDLTTGRPAAGMHIELLDEDGARIKVTQTNVDGRTDEPLLNAEEMRVGVLEIRFHVGAYFESAAGFLDIVPVRFRIVNATESHHVPLLCTPWAYSTYRGS
jgi:hydroxyisourate hydrolase